jgi:hypothetical protein
MLAPAPVKRLDETHFRLTGSVLRQCQKKISLHTQRLGQVKQVSVLLDQADRLVNQRQSCANLSAPAAGARNPRRRPMTGWIKSGVGSPSSSWEGSLTGSRLCLQLALDLFEKTPVGAFSDELVGVDLSSPNSCGQSA